MHGVPESSSCGVFGFLGGGGLHFGCEVRDGDGEVIGGELVIYFVGDEVHNTTIIILIIILQMLRRRPPKNG